MNRYLDLAGFRRLRCTPHISVIINVSGLIDRNAEY